VSSWQGQAQQVEVILQLSLSMAYKTSISGQVTSSDAINDQVLACMVGLRL
jgi:hypothetical protein